MPIRHRPRSQVRCMVEPFYKQHNKTHSTANQPIPQHAVFREGMVVLNTKKNTVLLCVDFQGKAANNKWVMSFVHKTICVQTTPGVPSCWRCNLRTCHTRSAAGEEFAAPPAPGMTDTPKHSIYCQAALSACGPKQPGLPPGIWDTILS